MNMMQTPFHAGEVNVQIRTGYRELSEQREAFIRPFMPAQHRKFFTSLPFVIAGLVDETGNPWATMIWDEASFIESPAESSLRIQKQPFLAKQLKLDVSTGAKLGLVGLELGTRRRNRVNGVIKTDSDSALEIEVEQSFGNCPQYIQKRDYDWKTTSIGERTTPDLQVQTSLLPDHKQQIEDADTLFVATRSRLLDNDARNGIDASHRGGRRGFVKVDEDGTILFPDFSGNRFFNTLGNIESDGRAGLLFPNFATGDLLLVTGDARVIWDEDPLVATYKGAERLVSVSPEKVVFARSALPIQETSVEQSPFLENTGTWAD